MHRSTIPFIVGFVFAFSLITAGAARARAATSAEEFGGKYRGANLSVEIEAGANGACTGMIHQGAHDFPLQAQLDAGRLKGAFNSQGTEFAFTASLADDTLTLVSGDATYTL
jgi:hypothetical protein